MLQWPPKRHQVALPCASCACWQCLLGYSAKYRLKVVSEGRSWIVSMAEVSFIQIYTSTGEILQQGQPLTSQQMAGSQSIRFPQDIIESLSLRQNIPPFPDMCRLHLEVFLILGLLSWRQRRIHCSRLS